MIITTGHLALTRQEHLKAVNTLESHNEELTQLKVSGEDRVIEKRRVLIFRTKRLMRRSG